MKSFVEDPGFYTHYLKRNKAIVLDEIKKTDYIKYRRTIDMLKGLKIEVIVPLSVKKKIIGILTLGGKETNENYNDADIQLLEIISAQSAVAIENALHYGEIRNFTKKLEREIDLATEELIRANSKLRQLDEAKSEFVSIASHQLRTPLTVIKGYVAMILDKNFGRVSKTIRKPLEQVFESNERLIRLVENLLNISRIESGRLHFNFEKVHIEKIAASVIEELSTPAKKKGLKLEFTFIKPLPGAVIDQEKIRQVILNLVDNAIKYTSRGKITVVVSREDDYIKVSIADQGMGIRKDDLADLFEKFTRGEGTSLVDTEGTGLGLYVAEQMVSAHNGKIWAESEGEGKGSKFCFVIPITQEPQPMHKFLSITAII